MPHKTSQRRHAAREHRPAAPSPCRQYQALALQSYGRRAVFLPACKSPVDTPRRDVYVRHVRSSRGVQQRQAAKEEQTPFTVAQRAPQLRASQSPPRFASAHVYEMSERAEAPDNMFDRVVFARSVRRSAHPAGAQQRRLPPTTREPPAFFI